MSEKKKIIIDALLAIANAVKTLLIIAVVIGGVSWGVGAVCNHIDSSEMGKQIRVNQRYRTAMYRQKYPSPGAMVTIKGKKYTVVRECWLGVNRYELRDENGYITYATNKEW